MPFLSAIWNLFPGYALNSKHDLSEIRSGGSGYDFPMKTFFDKPRHKPAVVHMGMSDKQIVYLRGIEGKGRSVDRIRIFPLHHATINEHPDL
jgi:hypothetical protein